MIVYRYESSCGRGPYNASWGEMYNYLDGDFQNFISRLTNDHGPLSHPSWGADFGDRFQTTEKVSGFTSEDKALAWFEDFLDELHEWDFHLYSMVGEDVEYSRSGKQIRFNKIPGTRNLIL